MQHIVDQFDRGWPASEDAAIRPAALSDIPTLLRIEQRCFATDRLTRRNFSHLLTRANAVCLVESRGGRLAGYALVLFNAGTSLARLYSFAVDPDFRGTGAGTRLLAAAEDAAKARRSACLRLEVRRDNDSAIRLYKAQGYREFGVYPDYYADHMAALRLEKRLRADGDHIRIAVPYYEQTTEFTCGPAALMMAMKALDPDLEIGRKLELRLWRESTTIFMTSGNGGCGPYGLALAARRRGFPVELHVKDRCTLFLDGVRSPEKKEVIEIVHEDYADEIARTDITVHCRALTAADLADHVRAGAVPIVLISSYRIYHEKFPHWLVVTGVDTQFIYAHDPLVDYDRNKAMIDCINMPIPKRDFERMARYGKAQMKATLVLRPRQAD